MPFVEIVVFRSICFLSGPSHSLGLKRLERAPFILCKRLGTAIVGLIRTTAAEYVAVKPAAGSSPSLFRPRVVARGAPRARTTAARVFAYSYWVRRHRRTGYKAGQTQRGQARCATQGKPVPGSGSSSSLLPPDANTTLQTRVAGGRQGGGHAQARRHAAREARDDARALGRQQQRAAGVPGSWIRISAAPCRCADPPPQLLRGDHHDFYERPGVGELRLDAGARRHVALIHPGGPHLVHRRAVADVGDPDGGREHL